MRVNGESSSSSATRLNPRTAEGKSIRGNKESFALLGILLCATALRLPNIYGNLPDVFAHDELNFVEGALRVGAGEIRGASFGGYAHGTLTYFLFAFALGVFFVIGRLSGLIPTVDHFILAYSVDPTTIFLVTRGLLLASGVATVGLTYVIGRRLFGVRTGLIATTLMAVSFPSIQMTYGKEDGLFTLLMLVACYCAIGILERPGQLRSCLSTGIALGAAAAVKYFGFVGLAMLGTALYVSSSAAWKDVTKRWLAGLLACGAAFLCFVPGVWLDTQGFATSFLALAGANAGTIFAETLGTGHWYGYLWTTYATGNGVVLAALFYVGAVMMFREAPFIAALLVSYPWILALCLTTILLLKGGAEALYYQVSTLPFLCLIVARLLDRIGGATWKPARWMVATLILFIAWSHVGDVLRFTRLVHAADARTIVKQWIEAHVSTGSSILVEGAILSFVFEGPQLKENAVSLERDLQQIRANGGTGRIWLAKLQALQLQDSPRPTYDLHKVGELSADDLRTIGPDYVVVRSDRGRAIVEEAPEAYELVFSVYPPAPRAFRNVPIMSMGDLEELRKIPVVGNPSPPILPGPAIWVYRSPRSADGVLSLRK